MISLDDFTFLVLDLGKEMSDFIHNSKRITCLNFHRVSLNLQLDQLHWTSQFTINRLKTLLLNSETEFIEGYECPKWVKKKWDSETMDTKLMIGEYFGKYSIIVYIYHEIYMDYRLLRDFEKYLILFSSYFDNGTHEERALKFFVRNPGYSDNAHVASSWVIFWFSCISDTQRKCRVFRIL